MTHTNFTDDPWATSGCGAAQSVYINDSMHAGGWANWTGVSYHLEKGSPQWCGYSRWHMRLFNSFVTDSHGYNGRWSVGAAHWDPAGHPCSSDLEGAEKRVLWSFENGGVPLWFVNDYWWTYLGNTTAAGQCSGTWFDGSAVTIDLNA